MSRRAQWLLWGLAVALSSPGPAFARHYPVGITNMTFTKTSVTTGAPRPLETVIWYPAVRHTGTAEPFGQRDAKIHGRFPLIVFSHGTCGTPTEATYLTMALAREGFIVAAPAHLGNTARDPGCLAVFTDSAVNREPDVAFVIDSMLAESARPGSRLARHIRSDKIAISGLSFGGFTTLLTAQLDSRVVAALSLVPGGTGALAPADITIPTMVIGSEQDVVVTFAESERAYAKLAGPRFLVELLGAGHLSVVDSCPGPNPLCPVISQEDAHALVLHYAIPFVRRYVAGKRGAGRTLVRGVDGVVLTSEPTR